MDIQEIETKSILTPSKLPASDYVINPYVGCRFGCKYCYASFMGRYYDKPINEWGNYVFPKINAPSLLEKDLKSLKNKGKEKTILLSSVTDPYQGLEAKYNLTRGCLEVLLEYGFKGKLSILTKSHLVLKDIDLFKQFRDAEIGMTITSTDDAISKYFETYASPTSIRLETLGKLNKEGLVTYAFIGPLLPHFISNEEKLNELFESISKCGVKKIFIEHLNLSKYILDRLVDEVKDMDKGILEKFYISRKKEYRDELDSIVLKLLKKYNLDLILNKPIYHNDL